MSHGNNSISHYTYYTPEASCPILNPITLYIHVHWYVTKKKNHQKIQRLKCKNKKNTSSSPKDVIYSLVLTAVRFHILRYSKRYCKFGWIGYKCSVPGTNLVIKDASNLGERFTLQFGGSHPRGEQDGCHNR